MNEAKIGIAPLHGKGTLRGFLVSGRWPDNTFEWAQLLLLTVRIASIPGLLRTTTVFDARLDRPENAPEDTVGLVFSDGPVIGEESIEPGRFATKCPPALFLLHPPSETQPSLPEREGAASGCILLPGAPDLGLEHRAAWVEAEADGTVSAMRSTTRLDPISDPDTAVLSLLLAA